MRPYFMAEHHYMASLVYGAVIPDGIPFALGRQVTGVYTPAYRDTRPNGIAD